MTDNNMILGPSSSPATDLLTAALAKAQSEYTVVSYDSANPHFKSKFASYAQCCESLRGPLTKHGISLPDFRPGMVGGSWVMVGTLRHVSGQWISGIAPLIMPKGDMQSFGAACTYAKRTLLMALTGGFTGEADDDGQSVAETPKAQAAKVQQSNAQSMAYEQGAKNAVAEAETEEEALNHLRKVELRAREKKIPAEVYRRVKAEFERVWKKEEVTA
jgi:hypothetical protein